MLYLFAIILPPLAVLLCGRPISAVLNVGLCLLIWFPGVIHAIMIVNEYKADRRMDRMTKALAKAKN